MSESQQLPLFMIEGQVSLSHQTPLAEAIAPFQWYLRHEGKTLNTIKGFTSDLHLMCQYFGADRPIGQLRTMELNRFLDWLEHGRGQECSRKSYARRVTTIKVFFKWLENIHICTDNPAKAIIQRSGPAPLQPVLSSYDIRLLLDYAFQLRHAKKPDARPELLIRLILETGIKKNECMELTFDHINHQNPDRPFITVRHKESLNVYKNRHIPIEAAWLDILAEYRDQYKVQEVIFPCTPRNLEYVLHDTARAAGIDGRVSFEILRWTCMVHDYLTGMNMDDIREKVGLSRISWRETGDKILKLAQTQLARQ